MMRHFPHHIGDYAAATAHLSFIEDAAYHRLLRLYYQTERPLPPDLATVARLVGARSKQEKQAVVDVLTEFFESEQDGYHQKRCDREIAAYQSRADSARENGRKGGRKKPKHEPTENRSGSSWGTHDEPTQKLTNNQEPITKNPDSLAIPSPVAERAPREPVSRSQLITEKWEPSEAEIAELRKELPWLVGELYASRMRDFRDWCAANATMTFRPAATWRGFMRKTRKPADAGETYDQRRIRLINEAIQ